MMLRFLLVGAVAALGFDLPKGIDVDAWTHSGRAWWHARAAEFEARHGIALVEVEGIRPPASLAEVEAPAPDADAVFATVIEDVVFAFAADVASGRAEESEAPSQLVAGVDDAAFGPEFADALNRWADGLSEPAEPATLALDAGGLPTDPLLDLIVAPISGFAGSAFVPESVLDDGAPALVSSAEKSASATVDGQGNGTSTPEEPRFAKAVQLTGQALQAWMALIQPASPAISPSL